VNSKIAAVKKEEEDKARVQAVRRQEQLRKTSRRRTEAQQSGRRNRLDYATPNTQFAMIRKKATIVSASSFKMKDPQFVVCNDPQELSEWLPISATKAVLSTLTKHTVNVHQVGIFN